MNDKRYYILFRSYEEGLAMHELLDSRNIENRISPTPRMLEGSHPCGMSLLIRAEHIEPAKNCIHENQASYLEIAVMEDALNPQRDRYC